LSKLAEIQAKLGADLTKLVDFEATADAVVVRPKGYLGIDRFTAIADILRPFNAKYVSAGKLSHWLIPISAEAKPVAAEAVQPQPIIPAGSVFKAPIESLVEGKFKVRRWQDPEELSKLRESIRRHKDVISPIPVRQEAPGKYEVLGGHRRLQVAKEAGLKEVSVRLFTPESEAEAWSIAWSEDALKEAWSPIAKATAFQRMREDKMLVADISLHTGESISVIENLTYLLQLPDEVQEIIDCGRLSVSQGLELLKLKGRSEDLMALATQASEEGWTVLKLRQEVDSLLGKPQIEEISPKEAQIPLPTSGVVSEPVSSKEAQIGEIGLVVCENCGTQTSTPMAFEGHWLCVRCAEAVKAAPTAILERLKAERPAVPEKKLVTPATAEDHLHTLAQDLVRYFPVNRLVDLTQNLLLHAKPPCDKCPAASICETLADNLQLINAKMEECRGWKKP
jgi:ParB/RepB/Spo0J family partition protein